jgi:hypothetical protein
MRYDIRSNARQVALALAALGVEGVKASEKITMDEAKRMKTLLQQNAPVGPPKRPGRSEGHYRNSIKYRTWKVGSGRNAKVYSTAEYAARLEFGFTGQRETAGLYFPPGRYYSYWETTPKPHWQPVVELVESQIEAKYIAAQRRVARTIAARFPN